MIRVLRVQPSDAQAKLPESRRSARYLRLPPRVRTMWMRFGPIRVFAGWRPSSKALFFPVTQQSETAFISTCVSQAQNAWGRFLGGACLLWLRPPAKGEEVSRQAHPKNLPSGPSSAPLCRGALRAMIGTRH